MSVVTPSVRLKQYPSSFCKRNSESLYSYLLQPKMELFKRKVHSRNQRSVYGPHRATPAS